MLDFYRRNDGPFAVIADLAGNPTTVLNLGFCWRAVLVVATWHTAIVWHHPCGIEPFVDGLILQRMLMLLRYGGARGENKAAARNSRKLYTDNKMTALHGGPATTHAIPRNLSTLRQAGHSKHRQRKGSLLGPGRKSPRRRAMST